MYHNAGLSDIDKTDHYTSYYNTLFLPNFTPPKIILKQYKTLVLRFHPDKSQNQHDNDRHVFENIHSAYTILKDQTSRHRYDQELSHFLNHSYSITVSLSLSQILKTSKYPITIMVDTHQLQFRMKWQTCNWIMGRFTYLVSSKLRSPIQRNSQQYHRVILCCEIKDTIPTRIIDKDIFHEMRQRTDVQDAKMLFKTGLVTTPKRTSFLYKVINFFFYQNTHSIKTTIHIVHHSNRYWVIKAVGSET